MSKATIIIEELGEDWVDVSCVLDPPLTEEQREGFEFLPETHVIAANILSALAAVLETNQNTPGEPEGGRPSEEPPPPDPGGSGTEPGE